MRLDELENHDRFNAKFYSTETGNYCFKIDGSFLGIENDKAKVLLDGFNCDGDELPYTFLPIDKEITKIEKG